MSAVINTNLASLFAQNSLSSAQKNLSTSVQRLSSGLRINSAADDAAGLSVAQNMQSAINAINMGVRNVGDATNLLTTADGSLSTIQDMLLRMKSLVVEAKNDSLSFAQKGNINTELTELKNEINNVATRTTFNGNSLLAGNSLSISNLVVGASGGTNSVVTNVELSGTKAQAYVITLTNTDKITITGADGVAQEIQALAAGAAGQTKTYDFNTLGIKITTLSTGATTAVEAATGIAALDGTVTNAGSPSLTFQTGAANGDVFSFGALNVLTTGNDAVFTAINTDITALGTAITNSASTTNAVNQFSTDIDAAINKINTQRATLGAQMNRLSYANTNLLAQSTNMQQSRSAVIDTDFAKETAALTKGQIMQQAATAMLAQANQMPNVILSLLK